MIFIINENIYDVGLILQIKERTGPKKIKKIINNLKNTAEEDIKNFCGLPIKLLEKNEDEKKLELKNSPLTIEFHSYIEDAKASNPKQILNNDKESDGENTPSTIDDKEKQEKKIDGSNFSEDE